MPFIPTADEWLTLSAQLLEARPSTVSHYSTTSLAAHSPLGGLPRLPGSEQTSNLHI